MEVAESDDPPLHLPVGADAFEYIREQYTHVLDAMGRWGPQASATAYRSG